MTEVIDEVGPYSDLVTEVLLASNHPEARWLTDTYVSILDYATSPRPYDEGRGAYERADRSLVGKDVILRSILNSAGAEVSHYFDSVMNQVQNCELEKFLENRNHQLPNAA